MTVVDLTHARELYQITIIFRLSMRKYRTSELKNKHRTVKIINILILLMTSFLKLHIPFMENTSLINTKALKTTKQILKLNHQSF